MNSLWFYIITLNYIPITLVLLKKNSILRKQKWTYNAQNNNYCVYYEKL